MYGLLNIDKPSGATSRDVVNRVQRLVRPAKAGHAGTLDPLARGVLIVALGPATRLIPYIQKMPKRYEAEFLLGRKSDTEDIEGRVVELAGPPRPSREQVIESLSRLAGQIQQTPPAYSALKVGGRRAYQLARRGNAVALAPRRVSVYAIELIEYEYPRLRVAIQCGAGTYVRSLGRDAARSLGTEAVMSALVRTAIGPFTAEDASPLEAVTERSLGGLLLPAREAVSQLAAIRLSRQEQQRIAQGQSIRDRFGAPGDEIAAFSDTGDLVAILGPRRPGQLGPVKNLVGGS